MRYLWLLFFLWPTFAFAQATRSPPTPIAGQPACFSNAWAGSPMMMCASGTSPVGTTGSCVASSFVGGPTAGKFAAAVCTAGTIILSSMPVAPNGYTCDAQDQTTSTDTLKQTANTTTSATFTATTVAADVVVFHCVGW